MSRPRTFKRGLVVAAIASLFALSTHAEPANAQRGATWADVFPAPYHMTLPNGLSVVVEEDHRAPVISLAIRYRVGTRNDPAHARGMTSLIAGMMREATKHLPKGEYTRLIERTGGAQGYRVTPDATELTATLPATDLSLMLWAWSDQMGFFVEGVDQSSIDERRAALAAERRARFEDEAFGCVTDFIAREVEPEGRPYHEGAKLDSTELAAVTVADVRAFHQQWFAPNNTTLAITGDVKTNDVVALVERYFGPIQKSPDVAFNPPAATPLEGEINLAVSAAVDYPVVRISWPTPAWMSPGDADLDVVGRLLSGRRSAFLYWNLVDTRKIATTVTARQTSRQLGSYFEIGARIAKGHTAAEVVAAVDDTLAHLAAQPLAVPALSRAMHEAIVDQVFDLEHAQARTVKYAMLDQLLGGPALGPSLDRYSTVTPDSVRTVIARYLIPRLRVITTTTPSSGAAICGQLDGRTVTKVGAP